MTDREVGLQEQGRRLAEWRASQRGEGGRRLSQLAAAKRIGASQGAWAAWEKGRKAPDSFFAAAIETLTKGRLQVRAKGWVYRRGVAATSASSPDVAKSA